MVDQRLPELAAGTPVSTTLLYARPVGQTRDQKITIAQLLALATEINDLTAAVVWADIPDGNVPESAVTQHVGALEHSSLLNVPATIGQAEAEAGTATTDRLFTAERVAQAIAALESGADITAIAAGSAASPSLAWGDGDTGFYELSDGIINFTSQGVGVWSFRTGAILPFNAAGPAMLNEAATATNPTFAPNAADLDTGLGWNAADQLSLVAGGVQVAKLTEASGIVQFIVPQQNTAASPSIAFGDGNTGFYEQSDNNLVITIAGTGRWQIDGNNFKGIVSEAPILINAAASATVPNIMPSQGDLNTGIGHNTADSLSLIAGGIEGIRLAEVNNVINITMQTNVGITAFAGGGQGSATQLQGSYNVVSTVGTTGDSVKLPGVSVGTQSHVKNDGANAMDVFPLSGDDLGAGVDTAVSVAAGASAIFIGTVDNTTWTQF